MSKVIRHKIIQVQLLMALTKVARKFWSNGFVLGPGYDSRHTIAQLLLKPCVGRVVVDRKQGPLPFQNTKAIMNSQDEKRDRRPWLQVGDIITNRPGGFTARVDRIDGNDLYVTITSHNPGHYSWTETWNYEHTLAGYRYHGVYEFERPSQVPLDGPKLAL
jgi:hypothetical protein